MLKSTRKTTISQGRFSLPYNSSQNSPPLHTACGVSSHIFSHSEKIDFDTTTTARNITVKGVSTRVLRPQTTTPSYVL